MNISDAMEVLRLHSTSPFGDAPFPHCDMFVLHAPGTCSTCDHYPVYQALRVAWEINFTNTHSDSKLPCPATMKRDETVINKWPGNRADEVDEVNYSPAIEAWLRG